MKKDAQSHLGDIFERDEPIVFHIFRNIVMAEYPPIHRDIHIRRLSVLPIHIPPLKQRLDDIALLAEHFLFQLSIKLGGLKQSLTPEALNKLIKHDWPSNIRELKNVVERAAILCDTEIIDAADILFSYELNRNIGSRSVNNVSST